MVTSTKGYHQYFRSVLCTPSVVELKTGSPTSSQESSEDSGPYVRSPSFQVVLHQINQFPSTQSSVPLSLWFQFSLTYIFSFGRRGPSDDSSVFPDITFCLRKYLSDGGTGTTGGVSLSCVIQTVKNVVNGTVPPIILT